ncbi:hypothetical protein [Micromonospora sp. NPDC050200]|uniref:hypothetical protein n=1 Tax=Micromonospora sp. NPDC050200 TaxID=3155664 RepID=UPI0033E6DE14
MGWWPTLRAGRRVRLRVVRASLAHDVVGPQRAGLCGIWLNRHGLPCPPGVRPDAEVSSLADLPAALAGADGDLAVPAEPCADLLRDAHPAG